MAFAFHFLIYIVVGSDTASNTQAAQSPARWAQISEAFQSMTMTKYLIFLCLTLAASNSVSGQKCSQLPDGIYIVEPDSLFKEFPKYRYEISENKCYVIDNGKKNEYEIIRFSECQFRLKSNIPIDTTNFTPLQKALYRQQPFFDIYKVEGKYYYFINRVDLHVRSYSGRFIKINE